MMTDEEVVVGALRRRIGLGLIAVVAFEVISLRGCLGEERVLVVCFGVEDRAKQTGCRILLVNKRM
jgi:hypothetical protein